MFVIKLEQDPNFLSQGFRSEKSAQKFIAQRMQLFAIQGYFKTSEGVRVPTDELKWSVVSAE